MASPTGLMVNVFVAQADDLALPRPGQQQQPHDVGWHSVPRISCLGRCWRLPEPRELLIGEEPRALPVRRLVKPLDHSAGITSAVGAIAPILGEGEHLRQKRGRAIGRALAAAHDAPAVAPGFLIEPRLASGDVLHHLGLPRRPFFCRSRMLWRSSPTGLVFWRRSSAERPLTSGRENCSSCPEPDSQ